jgi:hypothetical protein
MIWHGTSCFIALMQQPFYTSPHAKTTPHSFWMSAAHQWVGQCGEAALFLSWADLQAWWKALKQ